MRLAGMDKWIHDISPEDRTSDVALRSLRIRLATVQRYLPLAAENTNENFDYVHELRVSTRRADTAGIGIQRFGRERSQPHRTHAPAVPIDDRHTHRLADAQRLSQKRLAIQFVGQRQIRHHCRGIAVCGHSEDAIARRG